MRAMSIIGMILFSLVFLGFIFKLYTEFSNEIAANYSDYDWNVIGYLIFKTSIAAYALAFSIIVLKKTKKK